MFVRVADAQRRAALRIRHCRWAGSDSGYEHQRRAEVAAIAAARVDLYATLGIPRDSTQRDVKTAFYKLAKEVHPDAQGTGPEATGTDRWGRCEV